MKFEKLVGVLATLLVVSFLTACSGVSVDLLQERLFNECGNDAYTSPYQVEISAAQNQSKDLSQNWYKDSSFYYIFISQFNDTDKDGYGDIDGITEKLDYIQKEIGCDGILISQFFECSSDIESTKFSYDVTDFYTVNPDLGTDDSLLNLITEAHQRGMKVIFDFAPNSTSKEHPWFVASTDENSEKRDWYLWSEEKLYWDNGLSVDTWYPYSKQYYYAALDKDLPDLNYYNLEVRTEIKNIIKFWLNKGFDGIRIDGIRYLIEEENNYCDTEKTHEFLSEIRELINEYDSEKFIVTETKIRDNRAVLEEYFGSEAKPEFNMLFDCDSVFSCLKSVQSGKDFTGNTLTVKAPYISAAFANYIGASSDYFNRLGYVFSDNKAKLKQSIALMLLRTTVPFIYFGNETGIADGEFNWKIVDEQNENAESPLYLTKSLISLRNENTEFKKGNVVKFTSTTPEQKNVISYAIYSDKKLFLMVFNFSEDVIEKISFYQNGLLNTNKQLQVLIGPDTSACVDFNDEFVSFNKLQPNAFRVYELSDKTVNQLFVSEKIPVEKTEAEDSSDEKSENEETKAE